MRPALGTTLLAASFCGALAGCSEQAATFDYSAFPDDVRVALPQGTDPENVLTDNKGCYSYYQPEENYVRSLVDENGDQICV